MEEGKRIIHYLINYPHCAEGESEQGQHGRFWQPQRAGLLCWVEKQPCSDQPLPVKPQTLRNGRRYLAESKIHHLLLPPPRVPLLRGRVTFWPHFSPFFSSLILTLVWVTTPNSALGVDSLLLPAPNDASDRHAPQGDTHCSPRQVLRDPCERRHLLPTPLHPKAHPHHSQSAQMYS